MEIVVVVGQVPATGISIEYDRRLNSVDPDDILYIPSRCDMQAVEEAIRIRDSRGEGIITLIAIGPQRVDAALRTYLSMGADVAIHICDRSLENSDAFGLSLALSEAIRDIKYDLILCSELVDDSGCTTSLAPYIAEMLGLPQVSGVTKIELQAEKKVIVHRKIEGGERELILSPLPCLLGVEEGINEPRYPTFPDSLASIRKGIQVLDLASLRLKTSEVGSYGSFVKVVRFSPPRGRIKKGLIIDTKLSAAERMKIIKSGGLSSRSSQKFLTGEPNKLAEEIALILERQGIIRKVSQEKNSQEDS